MRRTGIEFLNLDLFANEMRQLGSSAVNRLARGAVNAGARVTAAGVKTATPVGGKGQSRQAYPHRGLLKKAIGIKSAKTRGFANRGFASGPRGFGLVVFRKVQTGPIETYAMVGARRGRFKVAVGINWNRRPGSRQQYGRYKNATRYLHLADKGTKRSKGHHFFDAAVRASSGRATFAMASNLRSGLDREHAKIAARIARRAARRAG